MHVSARAFAPAFTGLVTARPFAIDAERPGDIRARETLLDAAFGASRYIKTSERLRAGRVAARGLSLVARDPGAHRIMGTVRLWHVEAGQGCPALLLGPLAVDQTRRCGGVGAALMEESIERARDRGHRAILLVGDAAYYERFGFDAALAARLALPGPVERARFLGLELVPCALSDARGMVRATGARAIAPAANIRLAA